MAIDIEDGNAKTVPIDGANCLYVVSVIGPDGLEVSLYENSKPDQIELHVALDEAVGAKHPVILLRGEMSHPEAKRWLVLDPKTFSSRLPSA